MRFVALAFVGCSHLGAVSVEPTGGPPLGVDLTQHFMISQDVCDDSLPPVGCEPLSPSQATVTISSGDAVRVSEVTPSSFDVVGVAAGTSMLEITGDGGATTSLAIAVGDRAPTTLFVSRSSDDHTRQFPEVHDPVQVLWASTLVVEQRNLGRDGSARSGSLELALDPGATDVAFGAGCDCYGTGYHLGTARLTSPLASITLNVVDETAIADFTIDDSSALTEISLHLGTASEVFLIPSDAMGRPIVGRGRDPEIVISDPAIATVYANTGDIVRAVTLLPEAAGTTALDVTWGSVHKTFTLRVIATS